MNDSPSSTIPRNTNLAANKNKMKFFSLVFWQIGLTLQLIFLFPCLYFYLFHVCFFFVPYSKFYDFEFREKNRENDDFKISFFFLFWYSV